MPFLSVEVVRIDRFARVADLHSAHPRPQRAGKLAAGAVADIEAFLRADAERVGGPHGPVGPIDQKLSFRPLRSI